MMMMMEVVWVIPDNDNVLTPVGKWGHQVTPGACDAMMAPLVLPAPRNNKTN